MRGALPDTGETLDARVRAGRARMDDERAARERESNGRRPRAALAGPSPSDPAGREKGRSCGGVALPTGSWNRRLRLNWMIYLAENCLGGIILPSLCPKLGYF